MWSGLPGIAWYWTEIIWHLAASIWYFAWIASWFMIFFQDCLIIGQDCMKGHQLEVEAQRAPRLLVWAYLPSGSCHQGMSGASWGHVWGIIRACLGHHLCHVWGMCLELYGDRPSPPLCAIRIWDDVVWVWNSAGWDIGILTHRYSCCWCCSNCSASSTTSWN